MDNESAPAALSYRSPKTRVAPSPIHGLGLFAIAQIARGEIVVAKGGHVVTREQLPDLHARLGPVEIQVAEHLFIAPVEVGEREGSMLYTNHSCAPNIGVRGEIVFVAMRDIFAGEELTHDWCMTDDDEYAVTCSCGALECRRTVTGKDWQRADLQERYAGFFSTYLAVKIRRPE